MVKLVLTKARKTYGFLTCNRKGIAMVINDFHVKISLEETVKLLDSAIVGGSITGERIDYHVVSGENGCSCIVVVYEKYYYRAGNRLTLTVSIDNMENKTRVHAVGGGGGEGLFRFDWGAGENFTNAPADILKNYIIM